MYDVSATHDVRVRLLAWYPRWRGWTGGTRILGKNSEFAKGYGGWVLRRHGWYWFTKRYKWDIISLALTVLLMIAGVGLIAFVLPFLLITLEAALACTVGAVVWLTWSAVRRQWELVVWPRDRRERFAVAIYHERSLRRAIRMALHNEIPVEVAQDAGLLPKAERRRKKRS